jgi:16S rRNA C967 or C1407 C5-methylase (RsmB/RsmF family)/NOL1/NOP2/fmu family ribosome biogenesis protein
MNLPQAFTERTKALLGNEYNDFENALQQIPPVSVRINNKADYQPNNDTVAWCPQAYYLKERPVFTLDPLFHAGIYYVQEASSMFLAYVAEKFFPQAQRVLDLCAAPGGKSTVLLQAIPEDSLLVSNEIIRSRAHILAENMIKWGNANFVVSNNEPADFARLKRFFDVVVIDAPCSGEGMFRKDPVAISEWSLNNVRLCAQRQKEIVAAVWEALAPGGILVYSTCTFNREENEDNIQWICEELQAELLTVDCTNFPQITVTDGGYRFYPHKVRGEGLFMSVLRKTENDTETSSKKRKKENNKNFKIIKQEDFFYRLKNDFKWTIISENNIFRAFPQKIADEMIYLEKNLRCVENGIILAEQKGKDIIPTAQLALSKYIDTKNLTVIDLDLESALLYLRKDPFALEISEHGYCLVSYKNQILGWIKNLGNRFNNLYPANWRIRMKTDRG